LGRRVLLLLVDDLLSRRSGLVGDADWYIGISDEVLDPIASVGAAREHIDGVVMEREPHLDLMWPATHATNRDEVAVVQVFAVAGHAVNGSPTRSGPRSPRAPRPASRRRPS